MSTHVHWKEGTRTHQARATDGVMGEQPQSTTFGGPIHHQVCGRDTWLVKPARAGGTGDGAGTGAGDVPPASSFLLRRCRCCKAANLKFHPWNFGLKFVIQHDAPHTALLFQRNATVARHQVGSQTRNAEACTPRARNYITHDDYEWNTPEKRVNASRNPGLPTRNDTKSPLGIGKTRTRVKARTLVVCIAFARIAVTSTSNVPGPCLTKKKGGGRGCSIQVRPKKRNAQYKHTHTHTHMARNVR